MAQEHDLAASRVIRHLTGGRWTWPPVQVREVYPAPTRKIILRGRPVRSITSVLSYETGDPIEYVRHSNNHLELKPDGLCHVDLEVDVTYEYGTKPDGPIQRAIDTLSAELLAADRDDASCRLPERVTSINRQGVSWTLLDPMDFLDRGRTGLYEVDLVLSAYGTARKRSAVFSPDHQPPRRLSTTILPEPVNEGV